MNVEIHTVYIPSVSKQRNLPESQSVHKVMESRQRSICQRRALLAAQRTVSLLYSDVDWIHQVIWRELERVDLINCNHHVCRHVSATDSGENGQSTHLVACDSCSGVFRVSFFSFYAFAICCAGMQEYSITHLCIIS